MAPSQPADAPQGDLQAPLPLALSDAVRLGMIMRLRAMIPELADSEDAEIATASAIFN